MRGPRPSPPSQAQGEPPDGAAIAIIRDSGLRYEVGALGTTPEGDDDQVWATLCAAHEAIAGRRRDQRLSHIEVASLDRTIESLTHEFR
ncbi:thiamine-binding protein [Geodermatophilus sp. TF02-6]|uniref:thiamine-binding protein n=1 Tax=Geodermatophilus sp. TF02-6 TaxID=2250575 RepID=UPI000DE8C10C|nr:thiamine-binding protein [Geodermatophilus sp. TF02-6]RBY83537.1 thiamine-binding protein [Geodermatophilus sp. TF02-6]